MRCRVPLLMSPGWRVCLILCTAASAAAQHHWVQPNPPLQPPGLARAALAFDAPRGVVLLFGGDSDGGTLQDRTWTWNGSTWTEVLPATRPPARTAAGLVHDSARQTLLLFGGHGAGGDLADTWEWNGSDWIQRTPAHAPPARGAFGMAYDALRDRTVLCGGGLAGASATFGDTWEWDGADWMQRTPAHSPGVRAGVAMVHDRQRGRCVLFGGTTASGVKQNDTWEWDGTDWVQRFTVHTPSPRFAASMVHDDGRARAVLFGGAADPWETNDTWEYDGIDWQLQFPVSTPGARAHAGMAYDPLRGAVVLYGGAFGQPLAETWLYLQGTPATVVLFGNGCSGSAGPIGVMSAYGRPRIGTTFGLWFTGLPPGRFALLWLGFSRTAWQGLALPFDLGGLGAPGCALLVSHDYSTPLLNWAGQAAWALAIPPSPQLVGAAFHVQAGALDPVNALGLVVSHGATATIGDV